MREIWSDVNNWKSAGKPRALITVIQVEGSSLRPLSSKMAVTSVNDIAGSVSGGCVESAIIEEAYVVMKTGYPKRLHYGIADSLAQSVGLACGGSISVFVESLDTATWKDLETEIDKIMAEQQLAALVTVTNGPALGSKSILWPDGKQMGDLGSPEVNSLAKDVVSKSWTRQSPGLYSLPTSTGEVELFMDILAPRPRLVIIGAVHIAMPLVTIARAMNFHTIIIDARSAFATRERFPDVDELIIDWPSTSLEKLHIDTSTYVVCLSHDEKFDTPALQVALASPARYVGALGSRKTHASRLETLREIGVPEDHLARIFAPIGLNLGAKYPEEIALSIMAEIVAVRRGLVHKPA